MATVDMWCGICVPAANADANYVTHSLADCIALAMRGRDQNNVPGIYFGHLTSHQYEHGVDLEGDAIAALQRFLNQYGQGITGKAVTNYQPTLDRAGGRLALPRSAEFCIRHTIRGLAPRGAAIDWTPLRNLGKGATTSVTFKVAEFTLHAIGDPIGASHLNDSGNFREYKTYTARDALAHPDNRRVGDKGQGCVIL